MRNAGFKGTLGKKDISYLPELARQDAAVFEGAFDFLSALAYYGKDRPAANVLVLNSVGMVERAMGRLNKAGIQRLHAYLDHDEAGEAVVARLRGSELWKVRDASGFYQGFKDVSYFLQYCAGYGRAGEDYRSR
ncbi:MAG: toprim domain-containing protein [Burkholderiales bacterium]